MMKSLKNLTLLAAALSLVSMLFSARAEADYRVSFTANEDGLSLSYNLPLIAGFGNLQIKDDGFPETIKLHLILPTIPLASLTFSVTEINAGATPPTIKVHYVLTGALPSMDDAEGDLELPFCAGEIKVGLFKRFGKPIQGEHDLKVFMLLRNDKTVYDYAFTSDNMTGAGSGEVTPDANTVTESITVAGQEVPVELVFDYSTPFITKCAYTIVMPAGIDPLIGNITLPNARYQLWFDVNN